MIVVSGALVLLAASPTGLPGGLSLDHPVIGWHNVVTTANIVADTEEADYPASNLANPATHSNSEWRAGDNGEQYLTVTSSEIDPIDYVGIERHNFGTCAVTVSVEGYIDGVWEEMVEQFIPPDDNPLILRFEAQSLAQLRVRLFPSTTNVTTSVTTVTVGIFDTTGTYGGANYTIIDRSVQVRNNALVSKVGVFSSLEGTFTVKIVKRNSAGNYDIVVSETFFHAGGGFRDVTITPYAVPSTGTYYLGASSSTLSTLDLTDARDRAFKSGNITGTGQSGFTESNGGVVPMRYTYNTMPRAAVMYAGKLLVLERKVYVGHTPLPHARKRSVVNNRSESGNFLGRIMLGSTRETTLPLSLISPEWYREYMDPFLDVAGEVPFFFGWRPLSYPREAGFAWLMADPMPTPTGPSNLIAFDLTLSGVA